MSTIHLNGDTVTQADEQALREFTESLRPCELRTALYDVLDALSMQAEARVFTPNLWGWDHETEAGAA